MPTEIIPALLTPVIFCIPFAKVLMTPLLLLAAVLRACLPRFKTFCTTPLVFVSTFVMDCRAFFEKSAKDLLMESILFLIPLKSITPDSFLVKALEIIV